MKCLMVCAGEYCARGNFYQLSEAVKEAGLIIAVDGGLHTLREEGVEPSVILGDFDSMQDEDKEYVKLLETKDEFRVIRLPVRKDEPDTQAAAGIALERGCDEFLIYGAMGGRPDHTMANIQTLLWLRRRGARAWLIGQHTAVTVIESETFKVPDGFDGTISLFSLSDRLEGVTIENMKYNVQEVIVTNDYPVGTSNETISGDARGIFRIRKGAALLVLTRNLHNPLS